MKRKTLAYLSVTGLVLGDMLITIPFWHLEANPIVTSLGPTLFVGIKILVLLGLGIAWFSMQAYRLRAGWALMALLGVFHLVVVASNLLVITQAT